jgi:hypothetical protein
MGSYLSPLFTYDSKKEEGLISPSSFSIWWNSGKSKFSLQMCCTRHGELIFLKYASFEKRNYVY